MRPHKDFIPSRGRDRLLSLRFLSELPMGQSDQDSASEAASASEPRNAYDFMRRRREIGGDPTMQKWNASMRLANFTSVEKSPLCVRPIPLPYLPGLIMHLLSSALLVPFSTSSLGHVRSPTWTTKVLAVWRSATSSPFSSSIRCRSTQTRSSHCRSSKKKPTHPYTPTRRRRVSRSSES